MAAGQGFWGQEEGGEARARLSTLRLFNSTKRGGVVFVGVKKKKKRVMGWWLGVGRGYVYVCVCA